MTLKLKKQISLFQVQMPNQHKEWRYWSSDNTWQGLFWWNGYKYFIGYKDDGTAKPLYVMLPNMCGYTRDYNDETKYIYFLVKDYKLLKK